MLPGCEAWSHVAGSDVGVLVVHGFTGTPASVRGVAEAVAGAGFDVELPRLPGHGTTVADMLLTNWSSWYGEVERALARLAERVDRRVVIGQSMGATLVLRAALDHAGIAGVVCINPLVPYTGGDAGFVKGLGMVGVLEQSYRTLLQTRLQQSLEYYRVTHPDVTIIHELPGC